MLIGDGFFFIVGKYNTTVACQTARELLESFRLAFSGVFIVQGVTYLDSQLGFRNIKVNFKAIVIKEHTLVFWIVAINANTKSRFLKK